MLCGEVARMEFWPSYTGRSAAAVSYEYVLVLPALNCHRLAT